MIIFTWNKQHRALFILRLGQLFLGLNLLLTCAGCTVLHHIQIGEVDDRASVNIHPVDVKVSELGVSLSELKSVSKYFTRDRNVGKILTWISYFQYGPTTGKAVMFANPDYADNLADGALEQCPDGKLTAISSMRESANYPIVSGEIVRFRALCMQDRVDKAAKNQKNARARRHP